MHEPSTTSPDRSPQPAASGPSGYVAVQVEGLHPRSEHMFQVDRQGRMGKALGVSVLSHVAFILLFLLALRLAPEPRTPLLPDLNNYGLVWLPVEGPGGGGGGGGDETPEPPQEVELVGPEEASVPVEDPPEAPPEEIEEPPVESLTIPVMTMASSEIELPGVLEGVTAPVTTQGAGSDSGGGTGSGGGSGPGQGDGLGPGEGGGVGGGVYGPGSGVQFPELVRRVRPNYTLEAMRAKIQGTVLVEAIILPDGSVGPVKIVRSLDSVFGLDAEAVRAAQQFEFRPAMRLGQPVAFRATIEIVFNLR